MAPAHKLMETGLVEAMPTPVVPGFRTVFVSALSAACGDGFSFRLSLRPVAAQDDSAADHQARHPPPAEPAESGRSAEHRPRDRRGWSTVPRVG